MMHQSRQSLHCIYCISTSYWNEAEILRSVGWVFMKMQLRKEWQKNEYAIQTQVGNNNRAFLGSRVLERPCHGTSL
jgi:hypothetical protein